MSKKLTEDSSDDEYDNEDNNNTESHCNPDLHFISKDAASNC